MITMRQIVPFSAFIAGTLFLTGCATSTNLINDDVYSVKEVEVPIGTDITDETDYSAYVYNKEKSERKNTYYDQFNRNQSGMMPYSGFRPRMTMSFGYGMMAYNPYYNPYYSPYYGYYDPFYGRYGSYYGYGYSPYDYYSPYGYGYGYGYSPYGMNNYYYPYYQSSSAPSASSYPSNVHIGKRGSSAGMGGVNSRPTNSLKSATAGSNPGGTGKGTVVKPTSGRAPVSRPVANGSVAGRPSSVSSGGSTPVSGPGRVTRTQSQSPARPNQGVNTGGNAGSSGRTPSTRIETRSTPTISTPSRSVPSGSGGSKPSGGGSVSRPAGKPGR